MKFIPTIYYIMPNRKANRLKNYDYSQNGYYFVTICVKDKQELLGKVENDNVILNDCGKIVETCWLALPSRYNNCFLDTFIVMPNHIHGIIIINNDPIVGTGFKPVPTSTTKIYSLSEIIRGFKTFSSRRINESSPMPSFRWQRSFYDRVIRNEDSLKNIREYITNNSLKWELGGNKTENLFM